MSIPLFTYKSDKDNIYLLVKAIDKKSAEDCISTLSEKEFRFRNKLDKWTFIDTTIITQEEKDRLNESKKSIEKWTKYKNAVDNLLNIRQELDIKDNLENEIENIKKFVKNEAEFRINMDTAVLSVDRKPFISYNPQNL